MNRAISPVRFMKAAHPSSTATSTSGGEHFMRSAKLEVSPVKMLWTADWFEIWVVTGSDAVPFVCVSSSVGADIETIVADAQPLIPTPQGDRGIVVRGRCSNPKALLSLDINVLQEGATSWNVVRPNRPLLTGPMSQRYPEIKGWKPPFNPPSMEDASDYVKDRADVVWNTGKEVVDNTMQDMNAIYSGAADCLARGMTDD
jgi:hypothetical protein